MNKAMKHEAGIAGRMAAIACLAAAAGVANGANVSVGTFVCNPGAEVRVPVAIDSAMGLSGIGVEIAYDAQVAVCTRVEAGTLSGVFDEDPLTFNDGAGKAKVVLVSAGSNIQEDIGGTVATLVFLARNGTAGQFSDITVTKVELLEESGVRDVTVGNAVTTLNGMLRVMAADASAARLEGAQTVVAGTRLGALSLEAGDGIQAAGDGNPVVVSGEVSASDAVSVAAPDGGWDSGEYALLMTATAGLSFRCATNAGERVEVAETRAGGVSTYTLTVQAGDALAVSSLGNRRGWTRFW